MFSRALSQASRLSSKVVRSGSVKNVLKRHSHDHAGSPQPPYVQRHAPNKSVHFCSGITHPVAFWTCWADLGRWSGSWNSHRFWCHEYENGPCFPLGIKWLQSFLLSVWGSETLWPTTLETLCIIAFLGLCLDSPWKSSQEGLIIRLYC